MQLNDYLRNKLQAEHCVAGKLSYRHTAGALLSFYGRHATFVSWLAAQSNASMANLESADTWVWTNLVINRGKTRRIC